MTAWISELMPSVATMLLMPTLVTSSPLTTPTARPAASVSRIARPLGRCQSTIIDPQSTEAIVSRVANDRSKAPAASAKIRPSATMPVIACSPATLCRVVIGEERVRDPQRVDQDEQRPDVDAAEAVEAQPHRQAPARRSRLAGYRVVRGIDRRDADAHDATASAIACCVIASAVSALPCSSAVTRPSRRTTTRSHEPGELLAVGGGDDDRRALPGGGGQRLVDHGLGGHVHSL